MASLRTLAALFAVLLFIAHTTAFRTTVTTVDIDENDSSRRGGESCREQVQRQQNLNHCERYMRQQSQSGSGRDEDNFREGQQDFQQCCQQLRQMDEQCRCEGLRQVVRQQQRQLRGEELQEAMRCARDLPSECNMSPRRCEIRSASM